MYFVNFIPTKIFNPILISGTIRNLLEKDMNIFNFFLFANVLHFYFNLGVLDGSPRSCQIQTLYVSFRDLEWQVKFVYC